MYRTLIDLAQSKIRGQETSGRITCGQVSAAIETISGNLYSGVCIDSACSLGICAERNAVGTMVTEGEYHIVRLVCMKGNQFLVPCGACLELMMQLHPENAHISVLTEAGGKSLKLNQLLPNWWGNLN